MIYSPERRKPFGRERFGEREEVGLLRGTLAWGPAGVEAALATLIPESESLFFGQMDVLAARRQYENLEALLESRGVEVTRVRDLTVETLLRMGGWMPARSLGELEERIGCKAESLVEMYGRGISRIDVEVMRAVLEEDAQRYGEEGAIRLNAVLAQVDSGALPLANLLFGRDQCNVVGKVVLWSSMAHEIRRPEVDLWKMVLDPLLRGTEMVAVGGDARLEGGDTIAHNGDCLVGVGGRSNLAGVLQIAPRILEQGLRVFAVCHPGRASGAVEHQTTMHLDTFYMPGPKHTEVVWMEEAEERLMIEITRATGGGLTSEYRGTFAQYLRDSGADIIPLTREQQLAYQANFENLDDGTVLLTVVGDGYLRKEFERRGVGVLDAKLDDVTKGYGGVHCSLTPFWRGV